MYEILKRCHRCEGDGKFPNVTSSGDYGEEDCVRCNGAGKYFFGTIDFPTNVFESYIILEELDPTEYNALTDPEKAGLLILLACGKVDLNEGKAGRVRLLNWFGAESTTVANLTALLT